MQRKRSINFNDERIDTPMLYDDSETSWLWLRDFIWCRLYAQGHDADALSDYFLSLVVVNDESQLIDFLVSSGSTLEVALQLVSEWSDTIQRGSLTDAQQQFMCDQLSTIDAPANISTHQIDSNTAQEGDYDRVTCNVDEFGEEYDELFNDEVDCFQVMEQVESQLRETHKFKLEFSPDPLFRAISCSTNDVEHAVKLLLHADQLLASFKPCRHSLQGKCLRRDCIFDHNFATVPCRYWLYAQCSAPTCPFLHDLPFVSPDPKPEAVHPVSPPVETSYKSLGLTSQTESVPVAFPSLQDSLQQSTRKIQPGPKQVKQVTTWASTVKSAARVMSDSRVAENSNGWALSNGRSNTIGFGDILEEHEFALTRNGSGSVGNGHLKTVQVGEWVSSGENHFSSLIADI
jgi:hypothetical protein